MLPSLPIAPLESPLPIAPLEPPPINPAADAIIGFHPHFIHAGVTHPVPPEFIQNLRIPRSIDPLKANFLTIVEAWDYVSAMAIAWSFLSVHPDSGSMQVAIFRSEYTFNITASTAEHVASM